jgi:lipopolysaccharide/colanic/teichoic acid biosynthesis glycosyltransferase
MTCIWQTTSRSEIPLHRPEATALDLDYIRNASPKLDGALIAQTIVSVLRFKGAY